MFGGCISRGLGVAVSGWRGVIEGHYACRSCCGSESLVKVGLEVGFVFEIQGDAIDKLPDA